MLQDQEPSILLNARLGSRAGDQCDREKDATSEATFAKGIGAGPDETGTGSQYSETGGRRSRVSHHGGKAGIEHSLVNHHEPGGINHHEPGAIARNRSGDQAESGSVNNKCGNLLTAELRALAVAGGADLFGIADLTSAGSIIERECGAGFRKFDRAVALAVCFPREVIQELLEGPTHTYLHYYRVVNARLDDLALRISSYLQVRGFKTFPIPSSQRVSRDRLAGIFPHRLAASLAGLGWIGKSGLLVTREFGPRIRLVTILTNAPLNPGSPLDLAAEKCGGCRLCIQSCPAQAIKEVERESPAGNATYFDPRLCDEHQNRIRSQFGKRVCGICLAVCPFGK